jgi:hypothetical protein
MSTQQGPFHIERNRQFVYIRSHQAFSARLSVSLPISREGILYVLSALSLAPGMELVLSAVEHDDVVIESGNDGGAA